MNEHMINNKEYFYFEDKNQMFCIEYLNQLLEGSRLLCIKEVVFIKKQFLYSLIISLKNI